MPTRRLPLRPFLALGTFAATAAFGQATFTWTNSLGGDIAVAANWDPNGVPSPTSGPDAETGLIYGDELFFDGRTSGDLSLTANTGQTGFSGSAWGLRIRLGANQTGAVGIRSVVPQSTGTRFNSITIEPGAGRFSLGDASTNVLDTLWGGTNPQTHTWVNNSANPVVIHPNVRWRYGGGGVHTFDFGGTGDWLLNNYFRNNNNSATLVTKSGAGTLTWTGTNYGSAASSTLIASPVTINEGTLVLKSSDLLAGQSIAHNGARLKYDAALGEGLFSGTISGTGTVEVASGKLTLTGNNTYTGPTVLGGGTLVVNRAENAGVSGPLGVGGSISFNGGTLGFSANNTFDYSSRFDSAGGQAYRFDTGGQTVTLAGGLNSTGGTLVKRGAGTLRVSGANAYDGATTVEVGRLIFAGTKSGTADITVANGAALGFTENGSQITPATLTVGTTAGATLEFDNVNSTTTPPLVAGTIAAGGPITVNVNSGSFNTIGSVFPLFRWNAGAAPAVTLGNLSGAAGVLSTNGNTIQLEITGIPYLWTGIGNEAWDFAAANNWLRNGAASVFGNGQPTVFDDSATSGRTNVVVGALVQPGSVSVNSTNPYTIASSAGNNLGGAGGLTKSGSGSLTLAGGANTYTGATRIEGGALVVAQLANGGAASDVGASPADAANLLLNGGTLQYSGAASTVNRRFSLGTGGGALDASGTGALVLSDAAPMGLVGSGPRTLTLTGPQLEDNTLAAAVADGVGGATSLAKGGDGKWILTGTNSYSGPTTITDGTLQIGAGGNDGTLGTGNVVNNSALVFNRSGTNVVGGVISGTGTVTKDGPGTLVLAGNSTYSGATTVNAGVLQIGQGGPSGSLNSANTITLASEQATLVFDTTGSFTYLGNGRITGAGNVVVRGAGGRIKIVGNNDYTGWTRIEAGATFQPTEGNTGNLTSSVVTNDGTLRFTAQDTPRLTYPGAIVGTGRLQMGANNQTFDNGRIVLTGNNTYTGGTFIGGNQIELGDGATPGIGSIVGDVAFVNNFETADDNVRRLIFNRPDDVVFAGNITTNFTAPQNNVGIVTHAGSGKLTLTGDNTYAGGTVVSIGTLQVGDGGTRGSIGFGPATVDGTLVWNRSDSPTFGGAIGGLGSFVKMGAGTLTLTATNTLTGATTVSNGTLVVVAGRVAGDLVLAGGAYLAGGPALLVTNTVAGSLLVNSGALVAVIDKGHPQSNTVYEAATITASAGSTLRLLSIGPVPSVGEKFVLFNQPVTGGAGMTIETAGFTVRNDLAVDGSVTVTGVQEAPTLTTSVSGSELTVSWPSSWIGNAQLQVQTNSITTGLSDNWTTINGSAATNRFTVPIGTEGTVFYRLIAP